MKILLPSFIVFSILFGLTLSASLKNFKDDLKETGRGLARVDATLKSYLGNPLTGLVYAASLAIGAISILAMYESPLSPLPVPSLPKPPVGRFPPENPIWPPVNKTPVKLKQAAGGVPYAVASSPHAIYSLAPSGSIPDHKLMTAASEENAWLNSQNLVAAYAPQFLQQMTSNVHVQQNPPRRNDVHSMSPIQPYMSKPPIIRSKSDSSIITSSTSAPIVSIPSAASITAGDAMPSASSPSGHQIQNHQSVSPSSSASVSVSSSISQ